MLKIELYKTYVDHRGTAYPAGIYLAAALPERAQKIKPEFGRVFDDEDQGEVEEAAVQQTVKENKKVREVNHKTTKVETAPKSPAPKAKTATTTPKERHSTKTKSTKVNSATEE